MVINRDKRLKKYFYFLRDSQRLEFPFASNMQTELRIYKFRHVVTLRWILKHVPPILNSSLNIFKIISTSCHSKKKTTHSVEISSIPDSDFLQWPVPLFIFKTNLLIAFGIYFSGVIQFFFSAELCFVCCAVSFAGESVFGTY